LRSHLVLAIAGIILVVPLAWFTGLLVWFINIPYPLGSKFFELLMLCSGILVLAGAALAMTKEAGVLKELRKRTSCLGWILGNVPHVENGLYATTARKWTGVAWGLAHIIFGLIFALYIYHTGTPEIVSKGALAIFVFFLLLGCLIIAFSIAYSKVKNASPGNSDFK